MFPPPISYDFDIKFCLEANFKVYLEASICMQSGTGKSQNVVEIWKELSFVYHHFRKYGVLIKNSSVSAKLPCFDFSFPLFSLTSWVN